MSNAEHKTERSETRLTPADKPWRIAFPYLHEKRTKRPNGLLLDKPRNDAVLLAPKLHGDPNQCPNYRLLWSLVVDAATKSWGSFPAGGHLPIQDGDAPMKPKAPVPGQAAIVPKDYPWRKGHWIVEVGSNLEVHPPVAIMQAGQVVDIPARVVAGRALYKSGDYVVASINAYTFNKNGKFGCNFGYDGMLFVGEGEAIGSTGPRSANQMFAGITGQVPQQSAPVVPQQIAPMTYAAPAPPPAPGTYAPPPNFPAPTAVGTPPLPPIPGR